MWRSYMVSQELWDLLHCSSGKGVHEAFYVWGKQRTALWAQGDAATTRGCVRRHARHVVQCMSCHLVSAHTGPALKGASPGDRAEYIPLRGTI